jgi:tetratricopeptide (TPR) repeat protein
MRSRVSVIVISMMMVVLFGVSAAAQMTVKTLQTDMEKGTKDLNISLLEKTVKGFEGLSAKKFSDEDLLYYTAKAHFAAADCLDITSSDEFDKSGKGKEHVDAALEIIEEQLEINESSLNSYILKYYLLEKKITYVGFPMLMKYVGDWRSAASKAQTISPEDINVLLLKANEASSGMPRPPIDKSIAGYEKVLKKAPEMADIYYRMGMAFDKSGQADNAKKNYQKAIALDPNHNWAKKKLKALGH